MQGCAQVSLVTEAKYPAIEYTYLDQNKPQQKRETYLLLRSVSESPESLQGFSKLSTPTMTPDAILVSDDSEQTSTVLYQRSSPEQTGIRKRTISQPERFYCSNSVPSTVNVSVRSASRNAVFAVRPLIHESSHSRSQKKKSSLYLRNEKHT